MRRKTLVASSRFRAFGRIPPAFAMSAFRNSRKTSVVPTVPLANVLPPHAPRQTSGVKSCADPSPLATACHRPPNCQKPNGPDLEERLFYFSMSPNQAIFKDKIVGSSPGAQPQFVQACLPDGHPPQCPFSPSLRVSKSVIKKGSCNSGSGTGQSPCRRSPARALPRERKQPGTRRSRDSAKKSTAG